MTKHVVSLGDLVVDLIVPVSLPITAFQHQEARGVNPEPGGSGNFMIAGARLGMKISAIGAVGDDLFGSFLIGVLKDEGIATEGITISPATGSTIVLDLIDQRTKDHVFIGSPSQGESVEYSEVHERILKSAQALFFQGFTLHERPTAVLVPRVIQRARELNIPTYFDVGPTVRHLPFAQVQEMMGQSSVLMMTEDELPLAADGHTGEAAYDFLLRLGPALLVIKQGANGCLLVAANQRQHVPGFPVPVADTVGAGDCFDAAFIYGQLHGMSPGESATFANVVGAASVQKVGGGRNVPTCQEVKTLLQQFNVDIDFSC